MEHPKGPPAVPLNDDHLRLLVVMARDASLRWLRDAATLGESIEPSSGDLVVEVSHRGRHLDPDAIGWLDYHGDAPLNQDGTGPEREVWDIVPLSGRFQEGRHYQRWENAEFRRVPKALVSRAGLHPPVLSTT